MHHRLLQSLALSFIALVILQSLLGASLFSRTVGLSPDQILAHYSDKSFHGLLEVTIPHTLFIAVALMATLHFLAFIPTIGEAIKQRAAHLLFAFFILDQTTPLLMAYGWDWTSYFKLIAFIGFEVSLGWVWILIFRHTLKEIE